MVNRKLNGVGKRERGIEGTNERQVEVSLETSCEQTNIHLIRQTISIQEPTQPTKYD